MKTKQSAGICSFDINRLNLRDNGLKICKTVNTKFDAFLWSVPFSAAGRVTNMLITSNAVSCLGPQCQHYISIAVYMFDLPICFTHLLLILYHYILDFANSFTHFFFNTPLLQKVKGEELQEKSKDFHSKLQVPSSSQVFLCFIRIHLEIGNH